MNETGRASDGQAISRAVAVLRSLAAQPGASLGEIAKATGLARSTVQRLVAALNSEGLVTKNFGHQGVFLGMELARLGARVNLDARVILLPLMEELHARIGENIDLTILEGGQATVIEQFASNEKISVISYIGQHHPLHCTANGKAHLGQLPQEEALRLIGDQPRRYTDRTITDPARLMAQIEAFRDVGLYIDHEEFSEEACAVATTLPEIGGRKLVIAIAMPTRRFQRREAEAKAALLEFRATVRQRFGASI